MKQAVSGNVMILVTGASGFLGQAVVERLLAHGHLDLRCFVRPNNDTSALEEIRKRFPAAQIKYQSGNLALLEDARRAVDGVGTIYHLAAGMRGLPATIFTDTVVASKCLIEAVRGEKRRIVLVSSLGVYATSFLKAGALVGENTQLDPHPEKRNVYFHAKIWQERLFREEANKGTIDLVVLRPGVLYGEGNRNRGFPSRVGISVGKVLLVFGGKNSLPLSHVVNCAEAVALVGESPATSGQSYNIVDDDLPSAIGYLRQYRRQVSKVAAVRFPYPVTMMLSRAVETYHAHSHGQIPAVLTAYESRAIWKGHRFDNRRIKELGWKQIIPTSQAIHETFADMRAGMNSHATDYKAAARVEPARSSSRDRDNLPSGVFIFIQSLMSRKDGRVSRNH